MAQLGSALDWGSRGRGSESRCPDVKKKIITKKKQQELNVEYGIPSASLECLVCKDSPVGKGRILNRFGRSIKCHGCAKGKIRGEM